MTGNEVRQIVECEIGQDWSRTNAHGCGLKRCLVEPHIAEFEDLGGLGAGAIKLWVVLEETPETRSGYKVVFEEDARAFGLALAGDRGLVYLGRYGTFIDAFDAM